MSESEKLDDLRSECINKALTSRHNQPELVQNWLRAAQAAVALQEAIDARRARLSKSQ